MKTNLIKNIAILTSGTGFAQVIAILAQPWLRTLYDAETFGAYSIYLSYYGVLTVILSLQYEKAILLPKKDNDSNTMAVLSIYTITILSFTVLLFTLLFPSFFLSLLQVPTEYSLLIYIAPVSAALFSINNSLNNRLAFKKSFKTSSLIKPIRRIAEVIVQSGKYVLNTPFLLFYGDLTGNLLSTIFSSIKVKVKFSVSYDELKKGAKAYIQFPKEYLVPFIANTISLQLIVFLINFKFGLKEVGYFDLTKQILALPGALISSSIALVVLQNVAHKKNRNEKISAELISLLKILVPLATLFVFVVFMWGPFLFVLVFGENWIKSGLFAQIMVAGYAIKFIVSPMSQILIGLNEIRTVRNWQVANFAVLISLYFINFNNISNFLYTYLFIDVISYLVYFYLIVRGVRSYERHLSD